MIQIEKITIDDIQEIMNLLVTVHDQMEHKEWYVIDDLEYYEHFLQTGKAVGYKAVDSGSGELLGVFIGIIPDRKELHLGYDCGLSEEQVKSEAIMDTTAVLPKARGQNLQYRLMDAVEKDLKNRGYRYLTATIHPDNPYSLRNALKRNYKIMTTKEKYGGYIRHILLKDLEEEENE